MSVIPGYSLAPNTDEGTNQVAFNNAVKNYLTDLNQYAKGGDNLESFYTSNRQSPGSTPVTLLASTGINQFIGVTSSASPGALTFNIPTDSNNMDSFFFLDESINANTYNITLSFGGSDKLYGKGLSASGVTSVTITDAGGYKEILKVTTNKWYLIRSSA